MTMLRRVSVSYVIKRLYIKIAKGTKRSNKLNKKQTNKQIRLETNKGNTDFGLCIHDI